MLLHLGAQLLQRFLLIARCKVFRIDLDRRQPMVPVGRNFLCDRHSFQHIRPDHRLVAFHIPGGLGSHKKIAHAGFHHIQAVQNLRAVLGVRDVCFRLAKQRAAIFSPFWWTAPRWLSLWSPSIVTVIAALPTVEVEGGLAACSELYECNCQRSISPEYPHPPNFGGLSHG